ncbi:Ldh family oxidoreductase [Streptomyces sp. T21Q-yed]|uniref:Ldh family oxidoreductase n=1 Tax=Streptomyces sp. T21Q-yed TaxID=3018441 RepID=UPI0023DFEF0D|nr:Ldh family oxidoreductase [Streptomyces sp. T21Q-yed]MDF3139847.1 Ldh family oxidoreductase [Streptomyces sp. T21Q-yed]
MCDDKWWEGVGEQNVRASAEEVEGAATRVLVSHHVPVDDAALTARHLVDGSLRGHFAHGVERLPQMIAMLRRGTLNPAPKRTIVRKSSAVAILNGDNGLGPPAAAEAVAQARSMAASCGVGVVGLCASGHQGTLGPLAEGCAGDDSFGLVVSASEPGVITMAGTKAIFGTNPIAYAWPSAQGPVVADFSTAAMTRSELLRRAEAGEPLPSGTAVDTDGLPTRDARAALDGGLLPLRDDHKGALLSLLAAMLAGPVVDGPAPHQVVGTRKADAFPNKADFFLTINLRATTALSDFYVRGETLRQVLDSPGAGDFTLPGTGAKARIAKARQEGLYLSSGTARLLWAEGERP